MNTLVQPQIEYPSSDGAPLGENTLQVKWIIDLYTGFDLLFRHRDDVFLASDLFWYPVEGDPRTVRAADVMIVFGRPKGERLSYKQWEEEGVAPQIAIEVLSPSNRGLELKKKFRFYEQFDVEEYYTYDPDSDELVVYLRDNDRLKAVKNVRSFRSPRLGIQFEFPSDGPIRVLDPQGKRFRNHRDLHDDYERVIAEKEEQFRLAKYEGKRAEAEAKRAEAEAKRAEAEAKRAESYRDKLRAAGIDPDAV